MILHKQEQRLHQYLGEPWENYWRTLVEHEDVPDVGLLGLVNIRAMMSRQELHNG